MQRRNLLLTALSLMLVSAAAAIAKPDFSGEWKVNMQKSDFGPIPPPSSITSKISHTEPDLKVTTTQSGDQGEMSFEAKYVTTGKETINQFGPMEAKSTATWDGDTLVINTKFEANGAEITIKSRWTLSEDGKTIAQMAHIASPQGEADIKYILEKQAK